MQDKTILITGSTGGLGREVAMQLGAMGATILVHGRSEERGKEVVDEIKKAGGKAVFYQADLASLKEVKALADKVKADYTSLNMLINNAGIIGPEQRAESSDDYELTFAVNYLSHFLLTRELLPLLEAGAPARIINVASIGQSPVNFNDVMLDNSYNRMGAYTQSKLAQIMFTITLSEQLDAKTITVNSLHPATFMDTQMVADIGGRPMATVQEGAEGVMKLATSSKLDGRSGLYFNQTEEAKANAQAYDEKARKQLWDLSVELTKGF
jgi:NAD(P)-dependent dehydrogenase (short-subunit alcohol dehydrogenase family)